MLKNLKTKEKAKREKEALEKQEAAKKEAEIQEAESARIEQQRQDRIQARQNVKDFWEALDDGERESLEVNFVKETNLSPMDEEAFHDWIAEKNDF